MKTIVEYLRKRNDFRLRKWCAQIVVKSNIPGNEVLASIEFLYGWVTDNQKNEKAPSKQGFEMSNDCLVMRSKIQVPS